MQENRRGESKERKKEMKNVQTEKAVYQPVTGDLRELFRKDENVIGALIHIYNRQTADEQSIQDTVLQNGIGFNGTDAKFLSSIAEFYLQKRFLTQRQLAVARESLYKYHKQLSGGFAPLPIVQNPSFGGKTNGTEKANSQPAPTKRIILEKTDSGTFFQIYFPYDPAMVAKVKTLPGPGKERFNPVGKYWRCMATVSNLGFLKEWQFQIPENVLEWEYLQYEKKDTHKTDILKRLLDSGFKGTPFDYQLEGLAFLERKNGRAIIGDEMGLGKTLQAISYLQMHPERLPALIVCPASVKTVWLREINKWSTLTATTLQGRKPYDPGKYNCYIINYDILKDWLGFFQNNSPKAIIADEVHLCKEPSTLRTKSVQTLAKKVKSFIGLSGTPIVNRPKEFFPALHMVDPKDFSSFWAYAMKFCNAHNNGFGWDFNGATNTQELYQKVTNTCMIRRLKKDVLKDLPPKIRTVVPLGMDEKIAREYEKAEKDFINWLYNKEGMEAASRAEGAEVLVKIEKLKQLAVESKAAECLEWITNFLESSEKLVVFCTHTKTLEWIHNEFNHCSVTLDGSTPMGKRQEAIDRFQNDPNMKMFIGNIKATGVGITLTTASNVCFLELGWTPGDHDQAEDRVHRLTQEADCVNCYYLIAESTIEEDLAKLIDEKRHVISQVLDGKTVDETSMLTELLSQMKGKRK
jgi:SWI/SNF-related matrix-associated actin-dependent regulator 1 of chromatin subfamily A